MIKKKIIIPPIINNAFNVDSIYILQTIYQFQVVVTSRNTSYVFHTVGAKWIGNYRVFVCASQLIPTKKYEVRTHIHVKHFIGSQVLAVIERVKCLLR